MPIFGFKSVIANQGLQYYSGKRMKETVKRYKLNLFSEVLRNYKKKIDASAFSTNSQHISQKLLYQPSTWQRGTLVWKKV